MLRIDPQSLFQDLEYSHDTERQLRAAELLAENLPGPDDPRYQRLRVSASRYGASLREAVERSLLEVRRTAHRYEILSQMVEDEGGPRVRTLLRELADQLKEGDKTIRLEILQTLVNREAFHASPVLATRLAVEKDPEMCAALARAVGYLGGAACLSILKRVSRSPERSIRLGALVGLRHQVCEDAVRLLLERLGDSDVQIRALAMEALWSRSAASILQVLRRIPRDRCRELVCGAIPVLESRGGQAEVRALLREFAEWNDLEVLSRTTLALQRLGDPAWRAARNRLETSLEPEARQVIDILDSGDPMATEPPFRDEVDDLLHTKPGRRWYA